ncbi:MAG: Hint domain-containing protein, partial [Pseudonocardiaceae bacterium]
AAAAKAAAKAKAKKAAAAAAAKARQQASKKKAATTGKGDGAAKQPEPDGGGSGRSSDGDAPGCNSFAADTRVLMADGTTKPINKVKRGDRVAASDPVADAKGPRKVTAVISHAGPHAVVTVTLEDGGAVKATAEHPFWVVNEGERGTWVEAEDIESGDRLRTSAGTLVQVRAVERRRHHIAAHNLSVDGLHTYYVLAGVKSVLVHNASCKVVAENQAGRFGDMDPGVPGDGLTPHHMPQDALGHLPRNDGGAIVMKHADHAQTRNYGPRGRATKAAEAGTPFRSVLARDIWDLRRIGQQQYGDPSYYNKGIQDLLAYYRGIGKL